MDARASISTSALAIALAFMMASACGGGGREAEDEQPASPDADVPSGEIDAAGGRDAMSTGPLYLYMAVGGDDAQDGSSPDRAVATLERVQEILKELQPQRDVEVMIAPGTYRAQTVEWEYTHPDYEILFRRPTDGGAAAGPRPIFDGCVSDGDCPGGTWFMLRHSDGEATNLHFWYLEVRNYQTAISLNGNRNAADTSNGNNRIYGCMFHSIGNLFNTQLAASSAAVRLVNSDDNEIANNHFIDVRNPTNPGHIHPIYAAHMSDRNRIERNRFVRSDGDPVRIRDYSNDNVIRENVFIKVGTWAGYTDWYCDHDVRDDCTKAGPECPSWGNQFRDNVLDGDWTCDVLGTWKLIQDDFATGCQKPSPDARRVRTSGNQKTASPCEML